MPSEICSDEERYRSMQEKQAVAWEAACTRCGACCGITTDDPCENLLISVDGKSGCRIYETRFGMRKTISGKVFQCVPLRWIVNQSWPGDHLCGYKKKEKMNEIL